MHIHVWSIQCDCDMSLVLRTCQSVLLDPERLSVLPLRTGGGGNEGV